MGISKIVKGVFPFALILVLCLCCQHGCDAKHGPKHGRSGSNNGTEKPCILPKDPAFCYQHYDETSWEEANKTCAHGGGTIVSIGSTYERTAVTKFFIKVKTNGTWLGLVRIQDPKEVNCGSNLTCLNLNWKWQDGTEFDESILSIGKNEQFPEDSITLCPALFFVNSDHVIYLVSCEEKFKYICKKVFPKNETEESSAIDSTFNPNDKPTGPSDDMQTQDNKIDGNTESPTTVIEYIQPIPGEECRPNYCSNGATCTVVSVIKRMRADENNLITDIDCTCPRGYVGKLCNEELDMLIYTYATMRFLIDYNPVFADSKNTQTRQFKARVIRELNLSIRKYRNALFLNLVSIQKGSVIANFEIGVMSNEKTLDEEKIKYSVKKALSSEASDGFIGGMSVDQTSINIVSVQTDKNECMYLSTPCQNGAECLDGDRKFTCLCRAEYYGEFCQHTNRSYSFGMDIQGKQYKQVSNVVSRAGCITASPLGVYIDKLPYLARPIHYIGLISYIVIFKL